MKKQIIACFLPLILTACGTGEYVHSSEPRSTVYYGQPVADLYENFGTPTKATRIAENERVLIYLFQEIEKEWAYRYVRGCVMKFHLINERVVDWSADGQACVIQSRKLDDVSDAVISEIDNESGLFDSASLSESTVLPVGVGQLPADAFNGEASTRYSSIRSVTTPSNTFRGKASDSLGKSGQLPADAFDGKASATYTISHPEAQKAFIAPTVGMAVLPDDAFHGNASTVYRPQSQVRPETVIKNTSISGLPHDAFDGQASTVYHSRMTQENTVANDSDEDWGLFD